MKGKEIALAMRTAFCCPPLLGFPFSWRFRHHGGDAAAWKWSGAKPRRNVKKLRYQKKGAKA